MLDLNWDDLKVAYKVAVCESISTAAAELGVNYSTILRKLDRLEKSLDTRLFIRHQRGYQLTDNGKLLLDSMPDIEHKIEALHAKLVSDITDVSGLIRITTLPEYSSFLHPVLRHAQQDFPELKVKVDIGDEIVPLESGEAHISIRAGGQPSQADLVAIKINDITFKYYCSKDYYTLNGIPQHKCEFDQHQWIMPFGKKRNLSFIRQMQASLNPQNIVYQSNNFQDIQQAVENGIGIGPIDESKIDVEKDLVPLEIINPENDNSLWFVFHRELRRDPRVQALITLTRKFLPDASHLII